MGDAAMNAELVALVVKISFPIGGNKDIDE